MANFVGFYKANVKVYIQRKLCFSLHNTELKQSRPSPPPAREGYGIGLGAAFIDKKCNIIVGLWIEGVLFPSSS